MSVNPIYLFIDTSAYLKSKLNFSDRIYNKLKALIREEKVFALTSYVINKELICHVEDILKKDYNKLENLTMDKISSNLSPFFCKLQNLPDFNDLYKSSAEVLKENLRLLSSESLDHNINIDHILDAYFSKNPPFSDKKKAEFPDAIVLNSILSRVSDDECHIISTDPDWKDFCKEYSNLIYYDNIGSFIHYCNEKGFAVTGEIQEAIKQKENEITQYIKKQIQNHELLVSPDFNVADEYVEIIDDIDVKYLSDYNVIDIDESKYSSTIEVECSIDFVANITGNDYNTASYDKEDNSWYFIDDVDINVDINRNFTIQLVIHYYYDENHQLQVDISEIDGIDPIIIEYGDYDKDYPLYK